MEKYIHSNDLINRAVRSAKYHTFVNTVKTPNLEFVEVDDVVSGDFTEALKGVNGVIHTACPLPGKKNLEELLSVSTVCLQIIMLKSDYPGTLLLLTTFL